MGGNLFKLGRLPRAEYLVIENQVRACLDGLLGDGYRIPRYYASKPDFGDLDVVVSSGAIESIGGWQRFCETITGELHITQSQSTGHVYSTVVENFQVDFFVRESELLDATYNYLSFNDLGNLIGKIYRRFGLKYGEQGLFYVFRRESQPSYKRDLLISRDWPRILGFLELDVAAWQAGFERLEDMFAWVSASPYFSVAPYEDQDRTTERRARSRPTMARFIEWLASEKIDTRCTYLRERDAYVYPIDAAFPEAQLPQLLAQERALEGEATALRAKFGGALVREWTGLEGAQLGAFLRRFEQAYPREILISMEPEAIRAAVEAFPREE